MALGLSVTLPLKETERVGEMDTVTQLLAEKEALAEELGETESVAH